MYCGQGTYVDVVAAARVVVVHVASPRVELPLKMLFFLLLSLSLLVAIDGPLRFGLTRLHFAVLDQKVAIAEPQALHAATDIQCSLMLCDVVFIAAVDAAFDFLWAGCSC